MKKFILYLTALLFLVTTVQAKENILYFTEDNNRVYYESKLFNENVFMKHTEMTPGASYKDELIIQNGTNTKYTVYFKVIPKDQSSEAEELLESITMKIKIDGKLIYDGKVTGLDYTSQGINLQNAILLGDFTPGTKSKMEVETKLQEEYDNTEFNELSYIDWAFYVQYDESEPTEVIVSPDTMKNSFPYTIVFSAIIIMIGLVIINNQLKKKSSSR